MLLKIKAVKCKFEYGPYFRSMSIENMMNPDVITETPVYEVKNLAEVKAILENVKKEIVESGYPGSAYFFLTTKGRKVNGFKNLPGSYRELVAESEMEAA